MMSPRANRLVQTVLWPTLAFVIVLWGAALLMRVPANWGQWRQATCMPGACFCEFVRSGTVRQLANTWSSFAFVWVGLWVLGMARFDRQHAEQLVAMRFTGSTSAVNVRATGTLSNAMSEHAVYPAVFALALIVVGLGSAFYHASLTFAGQFADVFGMYLIGTFVLLYNVARLRNMSAVTVVAGYIALNVILAIALYTMPELRRYAFAGVIIVALFVEFRVRQRGSTTTDARYLGAAVLILLIAFVIWTLDLRRLMCNAESVWQGHAVWHVLGAVACGCVYLFYRSDRGDSPS